MLSVVSCNINPALGPHIIFAGLRFWEGAWLKVFELCKKLSKTLIVLKNGIFSKKYLKSLDFDTWVFHSNMYYYLCNIL